MIREAFLTEGDLAELALCPRDHDRLGSAYQVGVVRLFHRFPTHKPLELSDELLSFVAMQLNLDPPPDRRLSGMAAHGLGPPASHPSVPRADRLRIPTGQGPGALPLRGVLSPGADRRPVGPRPDFLWERRVVFLAESALLRIVGKQRRLAHLHIVTKLANALILACVIYWQALEMSQPMRCRGPDDAAINVGMLEHVRFIEWGLH